MPGNPNIVVLCIYVAVFLKLGINLAEEWLHFMISSNGIFLFYFPKSFYDA